MKLNFRSAIRALIQQGTDEVTAAKVQSAQIRTQLLDAQAEATSLRMERNAGIGVVHNMEPNSWAARVHPHSGNVMEIERKCRCGNCRTFPGLSILSRIGTDAKLVCDQCKTPWDFARDTHMMLVPAAVSTTAAETGLPRSEDSIREEALKAYEAFFTEAQNRGINLSLKDYQKGPDGNYWVNQSRTFDLISLLNIIPSVQHGDDDGPIVLPTDGPDFKAEYESFDPGNGSAGFGSGENQRSLTNEADKPLPAAWLEKRAKAYERHKRAYGPEAELRNLDAALAPIQDPAIRAQLRRAILRDDRDEVSRLANALASEQEMVGFMVGEGDAARMVYMRQARNVGFIYDAQANFCGRVGDKEARSLLEKVEKRDAGA